MAVKVRVQDFQSLGDVAIEIDGLTVVTGANNTGKSALMRAIRAAFQNAKGTGFIRHGASKATVSIEFDDGHTLTWQKGKGKGDKPTYIIDGGNPIHPGQGVPDEVKALGVRAITAGGRDVWPQIAPQFVGQVFLLDQPGSVMAEAVADLERVSQLNEALRLASSDLRATSAELSTRRSDLAALEEDLKGFDGLDDVASLVAEIESQATLARRVETALQTLHVMRDRMQEAADRVADLAGIEDVHVPDHGAFTALSETLQRLDDLRVVRGRLIRASSRVAALQGLGEVQVPDVSMLEDMSRRVADIKALATRLAQARALVDRLQQIEAGPLPEVEKVERLQAALQVVTELRDHHHSAKSRVSEAERALVATQKEWDQVTEELLSCLGNQCPVCGSSIEQGS